MASKTSVAEIERPEMIDGEPRMIIAAGRGKVGKSTILRWAIEQNVAAGSSPVIADGDRTNPTLAAFFPQAIRPPSAEDMDVRDWLNNLADTQIEHRQTVYLDLGGGDQTLRQWTRDLDLGPFLIEHGITPVLLHLLGSDLDDLAYLRDIETSLKPRHTAIILNEGMVASGRSPLAAFEPVISHSVFKTSVDRGAKVLKMPRLGCMQEVDRRRLSFADAQAGLVKPGQETFPFTARQMVAIWRRDMATCMEPIRTWII